jgi:hypothetical protein
MCWRCPVHLRLLSFKASPIAWRCCERNNRTREFRAAVGGLGTTLRGEGPTLLRSGVRVSRPIGSFCQASV